jgi:UDP-2-acetamido-3-amino-2,3-dideoxy-glucuronate N-acetyltransferase
MPQHIHPTAIVDGPNTHIGTDTRIWHFVHVMPGAYIGERCSIGQGCFVGKVRIGHGCRIQNNVSIYDGVTLEDGVFCGPSVVFTNVVTPRSHVSRRHAFAATTVRRGATLGANSTLLCGIEIGRYAFVGAGAVVTRDVPAYALVVGNPARHVGWACACGERLGPRRGPEGAHAERTLRCGACGAAYRAGADGATLAPG